MAAVAADVTGKYVGEIEGRGGNMVSYTFDLKQDGTALTGTVTGGFGRGGAPPATEISEGKVEGDNVSFAVVRDFGGNQFKTTYKGMLSGAELKLTMERPGRDGGTTSTEIVAKKQ